MADIDTISETYEPPIKTILQEISKEAKDRGYECSGPYEEHDEEYKWAMLIGPARGEEEEEETGVDVSITIIESEVRGDDEGGVAFSLDVVGYEGEVIGGLTPYNYTPDLWVPMEDDEAVEARWRLFSHGIDADTVVDSIDEFMARRVRVPASTQAPLSADLDTINRHRAKIGMRSLDPEVAGWGPEDVVVEARRIRALNPKPRVSFLEGAVSAVLTGLGVTGIVLGRRKR